MSLCRPVIVLGAERSGTSACAEMVHAWGAHAGDPGDLPAADELNPRGRWEYLPLWDLLAEIGDLPRVSLECNLLRWQHMMLTVLHATGTEPAVLFAEYEAMISDPPGQARRLAGFLDRQCATASTDGTLAAMAAACQPALRRNRDGQHREELMTAPQRALYRFLRQKARQPQLPVTEDYPMPAGWRELVTGEETLN